MRLPLPIATSRLLVRAFVADDFDAMHAVQAREDVDRWLYSYPRSEAEVREALEQRIARSRDAPESGVALAVELAATGPSGASWRRSGSGGPAPPSAP